MTRNDFHPQEHDVPHLWYLDDHGHDGAGPNSKHALPGAKPAGFWAGLWHGLFSPITFLLSLFIAGVRIYFKLLRIAREVTHHIQSAHVAPGRARPVPAALPDAVVSRPTSNSVSFGRLDEQDPGVPLGDHRGQRPLIGAGGNGFYSASASIRAW